MRLFSIFFSLILTTNLLGQQSIDGTIDFQTDPAKKYSIYVPSSYDDNVANKLMVGLHPFNTNRWDAEAWRDTLIVFAETNNLLLAVPDGGADGAIDDPIDTAFTSLLIDSMSVWYNVDEEQKYLMGFSWGGKTVYTYGLRRTDEFAGYIPIGSAINADDQLETLSPNASYENWYIVHGANDNPNVRFEPAVELLTEAGACLETNLLQGVGHDIDFPNRNEVLSTAFAFVSQNQCVSNTNEFEELVLIQSFPNPSYNTFTLENLKEGTRVTCLDLQGQQIPFSQTGNLIVIGDNYDGLLFIRLEYGKQVQTVKQMILTK